MGRRGIEVSAVVLVASLLVAGCGAPAPATSGASGIATAAPGAAAAQPPPPTPEELLRTEAKAWDGTPFSESGNSKKGVGNARFAQQLLKLALKKDVPGTEGELFRFGKLVERDALEPGDLVFFETKGFAPLRSRFVGVYLGAGDVALSRRETGVTLGKLTDGRWGVLYKTARRPADPNAVAPEFDAARYGDNRAALLRDIANAWSGTLYREGGNSFDGIGNDEFVREVYGAIYEVELEGSQQAWSGLGQSVGRDALEAGDLILYESKSLGGIVSQRHAGLYIGNGEFVHAVRGSAVTISKVDDSKWRSVYRGARRIDPEALARQEAERALRAAEAAARAAESMTGRSRTGAQAAERTITALEGPPVPLPPAVQSDQERKIRSAAEPWWGTPYKIGGTSKTGVDCSAFVRAVYGDVYGVQLPRTAEEQEQLGSRIDRGQLEPGDLVFFRTQGMGPLFRSRHVGVYLGNGVFAHASGKRGVTTNRLDDYYWNKKYSAARRLPKST